MLSVWHSDVFSSTTEMFLNKYFIQHNIFQGGVYVFTLLNEYSSGYCLIILAMLECLVVSYAYGITIL